MQRNETVFKGFTVCAVFVKKKCCWLHFKNAENIDSTTLSSFIQWLFSWDKFFYAPAVVDGALSFIQI